MTMGSSNDGRWRAGTLGGWAKGLVARITCPKALRGMTRAEFEQIARDFELSPAELYRLLTGRSAGGDLLEQRLAALELSPNRGRAGLAREAVIIGLRICKREARA